VDRSPTTTVICLVAAGLALLVGMRLFGGGDGGAAGEPVRIGAGPSETTPAAARRSSDGATIFVHVAGAVRRAGLYRLPPNARVSAALDRAGGPLPRAGLAAVNLAARVQDGQQIVVPKVDGGGAVATSGDGPGGVKPSLGSATVEELEQLDGIGPTLAQRIVEYRTERGGLRSIDELAEVEGIGEQRLESLREALQP
jgi:competence protein ComEA